MTKKSDGVREQLKALHAKNPDLTVAALARHAGVSRQRAHQIVSQEGLKVVKFAHEFPKRPKTPPKSRVNIEEPTGPISHTVAGTIGEMLAAADLMTRGWHVFFPLVRTTKCDLIAVSPDGERVRRIEVRCGRWDGDTLKYVKKSDVVCDHHAVIVAGEPVIYKPPIERGKPLRQPLLDEEDDDED